ncbi:hypothetical protein HXX76_000122 [Chlamydomonas incerta]|uniref:Uncharacterized protein n=1 Tax=Chlamydomonas incerta TaxID=51695 RepID=A0A836B277_CHLIN|nr:hypothetical protein HXX76_000122 [Chlamydomonas incerta]|eukprot:KAG2445506.1 hypothetical protein HXX76_000122 [Chlamydomonas incerta]
MKRSRQTETVHVGGPHHVSPDGTEASPVKRSSRIAARRLAAEAVDTDSGSGSSSPTVGAVAAAEQRRHTPAGRAAPNTSAPGPASNSPRPSPLLPAAQGARLPAATPTSLLPVAYGGELTQVTSQHQQQQQQQQQPWQLQYEPSDMLQPLQLPPFTAAATAGGVINNLGSSGQMDVPTPPAQVPLSAGPTWLAQLPPTTSTTAPYLPSWGSSGNRERGGANMGGDGSGLGELPWSRQTEPACNGGEALQPPVLPFKRLSLCGSPQVPSQQQQQQRAQTSGAAAAIAAEGSLAWGRLVGGTWEAGPTPLCAPPAAARPQSCWPQQQPQPQLQLQQPLRPRSTSQMQLCDSGSSCGFNGGNRSGMGMGMGTDARIGYNYGSRSDSSGSDQNLLVCGSGSRPAAPSAAAAAPDAGQHTAKHLDRHGPSYPGQANRQGYDNSCCDTQALLPWSQHSTDVGLRSSLLQPLTPPRDGARGFGGFRGQGGGADEEDELALMHRAHEAFVYDGGAEGGAFLAALLVVSERKVGGERV